MDESVAVAKNIAELLLAQQLPRRWRHVQSVAAKASRVAETLPASERPVLVAAAWLHDIGYSPSLVSSVLHALDGARWLRNNGYDMRIASLVAYHSCALYEAEERGLADILRAEFLSENSAVSDALWYSDMTTGPDGQDFTVGERLAEIRQRYGPGHIVTRFWARAEPVLFAAVARVEGRQPI